MLIRKQDESIESEEGKVIFFSLPQFRAEIQSGNGCFICGAKSGTKAFNNEHVIPDWVLRDRKLHSGSVVLPNKSALIYGRYVVPCCEECNGAMAKIFEDPISEAFAAGYDGIAEMMRAGGGPLLWHWLALIFMKARIKHRDLRWHLDQRLADVKIGQVYDWTSLHHIHCIVRSFYTGAILEPGVYGSLLVLPTKGEGGEAFDFADLPTGNSILIRIGNVAILAALDDATYALSSIGDVVERIAGPVGHLQCRELLARLAFGNLTLEPRPRYSSKIDLKTARYSIGVEMPDEPALMDEPPYDTYRAMLKFLFKEALDASQLDPKLRQEIEEGRRTFLFDDHGNFIDS